MSKFGKSRFGCENYVEVTVQLQLLCFCNPRLGCGKLDYRQQAQQMELKTGGMSVTPQVIPDTANLDMYEQVNTQ